MRKNSINAFFISEADRKAIDKARGSGTVRTLLYKPSTGERKISVYSPSGQNAMVDLEPTEPIPDGPDKFRVKEI